MSVSPNDPRETRPNLAERALRVVSEARREWPILLILLLTTAAVWTFIELADKVAGGSTLAIDRELLGLFRDPDVPGLAGPPWLQEMMRDFTGLGGTGVLTLITLSALGFLLLERKHHAAALLLVAVLGGVVLTNVLKIGFGRPRPPLSDYEPLLESASFPSGHSTMSAVVYLTIGALIARMRPDPRVRVYLLALSVLVSIIIGISRIYLGVHWPTDVIAGWAVGSAWALLCWLAALVLQRLGRIERS